MSEKMIDAVVKMMDPSPAVTLDTRLHILNRTLKELNIKATAKQVTGLELDPHALPLWYWEADLLSEINLAKAFRKRLCAFYTAEDVEGDRLKIAEALEVFQRPD
jgi:hypothetical protein